MVNCPTVAPEQERDICSRVSVSDGTSFDDSKGLSIISIKIYLANKIYLGDFYRLRNRSIGYDFCNSAADIYRYSDEVVGTGELAKI